MRSLLSLAAAAAVVLVAGTANAVVYTRNDCPADFIADGTSKVFNGTAKDTAVKDCEYLTPADNDFQDSETNVNAVMFFGFDDWDSVIKVEGPGGQSGSWSIPMPDFDDYDYMITFKSGQGTNIIAFLFNEEFASGSYTTPFIDPPFDTNPKKDGETKDVSHYTIFKREHRDTVQVPEPATLSLLGMGLLGLAAARRRRRS